MKTNVVIQQILAQKRRETYRPECQAEVTDAEVFGVLAACYLDHEPADIIKTCEAMMEDANMHTLNKQFLELAKALQVQEE